MLLVGPLALRSRLDGWLAQYPRCRVEAALGDGAAALRWLATGQADVVLLACGAHGREALQTVRTIMESRARPIVLCAEAAADEEPLWNQRALEAGALAGTVLPPPEATAGDARVQRLLDLALLMAEVRVVRRWARQRVSAARPHAAQPRLVGIGASTGGPPVLHAILSGLPEGFALPVLVVQHIAPGFLPGLVEWLQRSTRLRVGIAEHGTLPQPGCVYLAPDGWQMAVDVDGRIALGRRSTVPGGGPSVASLFRSLAQTSGPAAIGVLLTGMGKDGAAELRAMKERGAVTIAQDGASSVVHGMPGEAIALGGATHVLAADRIAGALAVLAHQPIPTHGPPP